MNLDFGVLPEECAKEMSLKFSNPGSASIPLKLITVHQVIVNCDCKSPPVALWPNAGHGLLILEVSRSHTTRHHSR